MGVDYVTDRHYCGQAIRAALPRMAAPGGPDLAEWLTLDDHEKIQRELAKRLVDLAKVVRPALNVVEGVVGRDGTGFHRGRNFPLGVCLAGTNAVTVDAFASWLMGFDPLKLIYLRRRQPRDSVRSIPGRSKSTPWRSAAWSGAVTRPACGSIRRSTPSPQSLEQDYDRYR